MSAGLGRKLATYKYWTPEGRLAFWKVKYVEHSPRGKTFRYYHGWQEPGKPPGADALLYRLPELLDALRRESDAAPLTVWWTEGEKDADAIAAQGEVATSHHGGARKATAEQAQWLAGLRGRVILAADRDDAGAADVLRRHDLLCAVGIPASHLRVVVSAVKGEGADIADHLAAGHALSAVVPVSLDEVREAAARLPAGASARGGYGSIPLTPEEEAMGWPAGWGPKADVPPPPQGKPKPHALF